MIDTTSFIGNLQSISDHNQYQSIIDWRLLSMKLVVSSINVVLNTLWIKFIYSSLLSSSFVLVYSLIHWLYIYNIYIYIYIYIYCIYFREIWSFCILSMYLFSQMPFKRRFCVSNFVKSTKIRKIREKIYTRKLVHFRKTFPEFQSDVIIKN